MHPQDYSHFKWRFQKRRFSLFLVGILKSWNLEGLRPNFIFGNEFGDANRIQFLPVLPPNYRHNSVEISLL